MTVTNFLSEVKDPRNMRGKRYNLAAILRLIVAGLLCNCNNIASIARFKKFLSKKLLQNLGFYDGITPCYSTLTIILRKMNPKDLHDAIVKVISEMKGTKEFEEVHIDGKTLRGSKDLENRAIQVLTGFNNKTKCVISFEEILNKDENKAMLEILQKFDIQRATITTDAAFDHSDICEEIIQQGADFAICLKGNEANLLRATKQAFSNSK